MAKKQHKPEEIVTKLRQVEGLVGQGKARLDAIRSIGVWSKRITAGTNNTAAWEKTR
jgi:hypothetical protein